MSASAGPAQEPGAGATGPGAGRNPSGLGRSLARSIAGGKGRLRRRGQPRYRRRHRGEPGRGGCGCRGGGTLRGHRRVPGTIHEVVDRISTAGGGDIPADMVEPPETMGRATALLATQDGTGITGTVQRSETLLATQ